MSAAEQTPQAELRAPALCTCPIRGGAHVSGQHLHRGYRMRVLAQTLLHFHLHPPFDLQQLLPAQLQSLQGLLAGTVLVSQPVGHRRHHSRPFAAAILGPEEANVAVGHQPPHCLVKTLGKTAAAQIKRQVATVTVVQTVAA